jgi:drug/metabolite transporter (DMT)-like permease
LDAVGAALLWGISLGVAKPLVLAWGPLLPALFLFIFMTLALYIFLRPPLSRIRSSLDPVAAGAGILIAFGWLAANTAVQTVPVSLLSPISATYPLVTIALAYSRLGERPQPLQWFGIALAIAGVALVSL